MPWGPATAPRRCPDPASCFVPAPPRRGAKHALHTLLRPAAPRAAAPPRHAAIKRGCIVTMVPLEAAGARPRPGLMCQELWGAGAPL
jgi:hypothetical protein